MVNNEELQNFSLRGIIIYMNYVLSVKCNTQ